MDSPFLDLSGDFVGLFKIIKGPERFMRISWGGHAARVVFNMNMH
jgi:hypothetical protein